DDEEDRAPDQKLLAPVDVGSVLRGDPGAQQDLKAIYQPGCQHLGAVGKGQIFCLVFVQDVGQHATAGIGGEAVVVVAADPGKQRGDAAGGNSDGERRLGPLPDGGELGARRGVDDLRDLTNAATRSRASKYRHGLPLVVTSAPWATTGPGIGGWEY